MTKKKLKLKKSVIKVFLILVFSGTLVYSVFQVYKWQQDNKKVSALNKKLEEKAPQTATDVLIDDNGAPAVASLVETTIDELKNINKDIVGWIKINNTNINYPIVQTKNNDYYLNHSFDKTKNKAGWIFADYKNSLDEVDKNIILYGHNRIDGSMFGTLKTTFRKEWLNDKTNYYISLNINNKNYIYKVFSIYETPLEDYYLKKEFASNEEYLAFLITIESRSIHNFKPVLKVEDKILTLSTCSNNNQSRLVLHAKLLYEKQVE